jgi:ankyrin repeat protein
MGNVDVNQKDISQQTPLHLAVANGHIECVRQILLSPDVLVKEKDDKGNTALLLASSENFSLFGMLILSDPSELSTIS